jgi:hypothetical protein
MACRKRERLPPSHTVADVQDYRILYLIRAARRAIVANECGYSDGKLNNFMRVAPWRFCNGNPFTRYDKVKRPMQSEGEDAPAGAILVAAWGAE